MIFIFSLGIQRGRKQDVDNGESDVDLSEGESGNESTENEAVEEKSRPKAVAKGLIYSYVFFWFNKAAKLLNFIYFG